MLALGAAQSDRNRMKFSCHRCQTRYSIDDQKVRGKILKVRCKKCAELIIVRERSTTGRLRDLTRLPEEGAEATGSLKSRLRAAAASAPTPAPPPGPAAAAPAASEPPIWHYSIDGRAAGPCGESEIHGRIMAGQIGPDAFMWCDGMIEWAPIGHIPQFAPALTSASPRLGTPPPPPPGSPSATPPEPPKAPPSVEADAGEPEGPLATPPPDDHPFEGEDDEDWEPEFALSGLFDVAGEAAPAGLAGAKASAAEAGEEAAPKQPAEEAPPNEAAEEGPPSVGTLAAKPAAGGEEAPGAAPGIAPEPEAVTAVPAAAAAAAASKAGDPPRWGYALLGVFGLLAIVLAVGIALPTTEGEPDEAEASTLATVPSRAVAAVAVAVAAAPPPAPIRPPEPPPEAEPPQPAEPSEAAPEDPPDEAQAADGALEITFEPDALWSDSDLEEAAASRVRAKERRARRRAKRRRINGAKAAQAKASAGTVPMRKPPPPGSMREPPPPGSNAPLKTRRASTGRTRPVGGLSAGRTGKAGGLAAMAALESARGGSGVNRSRLGLLAKTSAEAMLPASLGANQIKTVIKRHRKGVTTCLERHLKKEGSSSVDKSKVVISFAIQQSGKPARIRLSDGFGSSVFGRCVTRQIANWRFPRFRGGEVPVNYPVILTAAH